MTDRTKNTNPEISAQIAGIGYLSPRGGRTEGSGPDGT